LKFVRENSESERESLISLLEPVTDPILYRQQW